MANFRSPQEVEGMAEIEAVEWKPVQDLAESGGELPIRYIQRADKRPNDAAPPPTPVPVVDLSRLLQSDGEDEGANLRSALQSWGLFQLIGHGMTSSFLDEVRNIVKKFFQLPIEEKKKYRSTEGNTFMEGYGNDIVTTEDQILDWADRLYLIVQPEDERKLDLWPRDPRSFREIIHEYSMNTSMVAKHLLRSMAKLLELDEDYLINQIGDRPRVHARFNYYPPCPRPDLALGVQPHSDGTVITILLPDKDVEGLQVLKDGEWVKVPTIPNALLVNMGDHMEIMSNGIFFSPMHRVVTNPTRDRISVAMFYVLEPEKELKPADELVDKTRPRLYKNMKAKDYRALVFENLVHGIRALDRAKFDLQTST